MRTNSGLINPSKVSAPEFELMRVVSHEYGSAKRQNLNQVDSWNFLITIWVSKVLSNRARVILYGRNR